MSHAFVDNPCAHLICMDQPVPHDKALFRETSDVGVHNVTNYYSTLCLELPQN